MSEENRRGSSLFSGPAVVSGTDTTTQQSAGPDNIGDAPPPQPSSGTARRASTVLQLGALGGIDFDDSDYEDSDDESPSQGGVGGAPSGQGAGGPNHRPYVGGFAAAAYEAARAHHTQNQVKQQQDQQQQRPPPSVQQKEP